jgi:Tol biopolymer transport system component
MRISPLKVVLAGVLLAVALAVLLLTLVAAETRAQAAFPGENGKIAFVSTRGGLEDIYTMGPDGSNQTRLAYLMGDERVWSPFADPAWSPDGTKIAFEAIWWDVDSSGYIYVINADGSSDATRITPGLNPAWSPDGTKIAFDMETFDSRYRLHDIYVTSADGSGPFPQTQLTSNDSTYDFDPAWSPDGAKIAFASRPEEAGIEGGCEGICVMNPDGLGQTPLTNDLPSYVQSGPEWSPDGTKIAFAMADGEIYTINADGSNLANITNSSTEDRDPAWSPDGTKIAFTSYRDGNPEIYTMNTDGSNPIRLTNNSAIDREPTWQPLPGPTLPTSKAECKKGGYEDFGFKKQRLCIASVQR